MSGTLAATQLFNVNNATITGGGANGAEVAAYDAARNLVYVLGADGVNALNANTGALAFAVPKSAIQQPGGGATLSLGTANSVAINGNNLAIALDGAAPGTAGAVAVFTVNAAGTAATWRATATGTVNATTGATTGIGAVPDMITFTGDGTRLLVAIEGEPSPGYAIDPAGGLASIDVATWTPTFYGFGGFDAQAAALRSAGVKLASGIPGTARNTSALPSVDIEPEYITISGNTAYVTLQENNAIGVFNLATNAWTGVLPLGLINHSTTGNGIDTSDRDGGAIIREVPIFGMYQPDGIGSFVQNGITYLVTANEGDARDYGGDFVEAVRISALVPATGSTPPTGMPGLSASLLSAIQSRRGDADLGRLEVSRWAGDTNNDGLIDQLQVFGGRGFSIWEVGGTASAPTLTQRYNSGNMLDTIIASQAPVNYDDTRSDNKGAEPEGITIGTIGGQTYVFVGLERANANAVFRIDSPTSVSFQGLALRAGDTAPEVSAFAPASGSTPARLFVANEVSTTLTAYNIVPTTGNYQLQILHASDFEAGLTATRRAPQFAAIVDKLEDLVPNSVTISSGDNFIPGPFAAAGTDPSVIPALREYYARVLGFTAGDLSTLFGTTPPFFAADIAILNAIGIQASALGNHDFDLGTNALNAVVDFITSGSTAPLASRITNVGAQFPYLSANLDFSQDANIRAIVTATLREASTYATTGADIADSQSLINEAADVQIAPWTTIVRGGQTIGVLGLTTQLLASISAPGLTRVLDPASDGGVDNMAELATIIQPLIDQMQAQGINKIILSTHLQQYTNELALAPLLRGVDVILAGGSHQLFNNTSFALRSGDRAVESYPVFRSGADGNPVLVVSTPSEYAYVGRMVLTFDANGVLIPDPDGTGPLLTGGLNPAISGEYVTTDATVASLYAANENPYAAGTRGGNVRSITDAVGAVINTKDGVGFGLTKTFLEGRRAEVRTEETNLGNLTADANLFLAKQLDAGVLVSHKNGGGIRAEIGTLSSGAVSRELPPQANPSAGKVNGGVSQLDIENSLRFNNSLSIVAVSAANLKVMLEHSVAASTGTATPGQFGQWGGLSFSWDPTGTAQTLSGTGATATVATAGTRIKTAVILNEDGTVRDTIVQNGLVVGDSARAIKMVTLNFLADGGDSYPFPAFTIAGSRVDLQGNASLSDGRSTAFQKGTEQDALAEFMLATHNGLGRQYGMPDTAAAGDLRVVNLSARADITQQVSAAGVAGSTASDLVTGTAGNDTLTATLGRDTFRGGAGFDIVNFANVGRGDGGFAYNASGKILGFGWAAADRQGVTYVDAVEQLRMFDGRVDFLANSLPGQVNALYRGMLGREADPLGQSFWTERMEAGASVASVALAILNSAEGFALAVSTSLTAYITNLYQTALGRAPDAAGLSFWTGVANAAGPNGRALVADGIVRSSEAAGDPTGSAGRGIVTADFEMTWINLNYQTLLGRNPDQQGLQIWDNAMEAGLSQQGLTRAFVAGTEFQTRFAGLDNAGFVEQMYVNILGRSSDAPGLAAFTTALNNNTLTRADAAFAMLGSAEAIPAYQLLTSAGVDLL
jgi:2',3'-cyclic-nucleotide 2'-phosphodiesterase (5'-nucleotidase family)